MVAYRGPREGHDAWQGDAYHLFLMQKTAELISHPVELAHELHLMDREILKAKLASGSLPKDVHDEAMQHQANVNRQHPDYQRVCARRKKLVEHEEAKAHFDKITELLAEHRGNVSQERQLEIHAELKGLTNRLTQIENSLDAQQDDQPTERN
jgi:hypothetical protein